NTAAISTFQPTFDQQRVARGHIIRIVDNGFLIEVRRTRIQATSPTAQEGAAHDRLGHTVAVSRIAQGLAEAQIAEQLTQRNISRFVLDTKNEGVVELNVIA